ncbi:MAG TPA: CDP-alcohol phosphatidyltransferase family protein [Actinomycetota bacterium]|nr:CDP-alcohol phosphatidyltransferase family protein [Actinomycetota bacterium]
MTFEADERGAKKRDYWWTVLFTDPIAIPLSRFLAKKRWLTPDQVTIVALILGILVGVLFATGERWGLIAGGVTFYAAFIVDCVDGKLARALGVTSARGEHLDALADGGRRASASLGIGILLWGEDPILWVLIYVVLAYYFLEISGAEKGQSGSGLGGKWSQALAKRRLLPNPGMPDVQAIVFILGPITGLVVPALWLGIAMVTVAILMTIRRRWAAGGRS